MSSARSDESNYEARNETKVLKSLQKQEGGDHYKKMAIEPAEYIHKNSIGFLAGNAIKYTSRYKSKGGKEYIKKAIHYLQMILEMEYGEKL